MPRSPADNQQLKDARRSDILRAATRVFAKKGFTDAKISDVAKEAGLSHGLVYHYFENKDAVFQAILEDKLERSRQVMEADDTIEGSTLDRMRASLALWLDRVRAEPEMSHVITQALVNDSVSPQTRERMREHMREGYLSAAHRIAEGQKRGEIGTHATANELATFLTCFMRGLAFTTMVDYGVEFEVPSADTLARVMLPDAELAELARASIATAARPPQKRAARVARPSKKNPASKKSPVRKAVR